MKIILLSDPHVTDQPGGLKGVDTARNLAKAVEHVNAHHEDAAFILVTGDLVNDGTAAEYRVLAQSLSSARLPVHLIPGNHDRRRPLCDAFPALSRTEDGFIQYQIETPRGVFLALDSLNEAEPASPGGILCEARLDWLSQKLAENVDKDIYVAVHHPAWPVGMPHMDAMGLRSPDTFATLLKAHGRVRHIFVGHLHRPVHGVWNGIPWSCQSSSFYQFPFTMTEEKNPVPSPLPPTFGVVVIDGTVMAHHTEAIPGATLRV